MSDIKSYMDIGKKMLEHSLFKEKYNIESPSLPGSSLVEKTLWTICKEKDGDNLRDQSNSPTASITRKLNNLFNTGG
jgi:hypothetical protein